MAIARRASRAARAALILVVGALLLTPAGAGVAAGDDGDGPLAATIRSDRALQKLDDQLRALVDKGSTKEVTVFATIRGNGSAARELLDDARVASVEGAAIVVGDLRVPEAVKLAGKAGVVSVNLVRLGRTARPPVIPADGTRRKVAHSGGSGNVFAHLEGREVPYADAPAPKGSNFDALKNLDVLDAKTHSFAEAWNAGFAGEGTTVGVLDGGTDFGHPDLLGTWQTWSGATDTGTTDDGWNGWPKAFDPYDTLVWLVAPDFVEQGLTWYTLTEAKQTTQKGQDAKKGIARVAFDTRTGPSRNFSAPDGFNMHEYRLQAAWTKSGTVRLGSHPDDHLLQLYGERPAFVVVDPNTAGVYDTVYVDLDNDYDFSDEKPVSRGSPASYRDMNGDGYLDVSGGLLYYISDGTSAEGTRAPGGMLAFGLSLRAASGQLLAWTGDFDPAIDGHGTLTASNVVGQGVVNGLAPCFQDLKGAPGAEPCGYGRKQGGTYPGAVIGGAPKAKLAPFGDIYFSFEFSTQFGYYLSTRNGVDVTTNSYGDSAVDNDGFDAASQEADIWHAGSRTTPLFSTGNGAPGYGTTAPPSPASGISVAASTQFGGTGWDSIANESQIVDDDVMVWSNRGPGATGAPGVDVVADGAFSAGDLTLNTVLDGQYAWETWGGTSRSAPVAGAATALVYQAYRSTHPGPVPANFWQRAKELLKSSANDLGYDSWTQGSGSVDAGRAVRLAAGTDGATVSPSEWRAGDYRGTEWGVFTHTMSPGESDTQSFAVSGGGTWNVSDRYLTKTDTETMSFTSKPLAQESAYNFNAPDYLLDVTDLVKSHPNADLMVVHANYPHAQFDGDGDYAADQSWRLLAYNWTDVDGNGRLWRDRNGNGVVNHKQKGSSSNIDGNLDINFRASDMDELEYVRFMYHRPGANTLQAFVRDPYDRMADGVYLGLQHPDRDPAIQTTDFEIQIDFYENTDWPWLSTPATASGAFTASITVPTGTPYGLYDGALVLGNGGDSIVVPVSVAVAADVPQDASGKVTGNIRFGGADVASAQADRLYNNGAVFGASDWTWREESGDWRFFFMDVGQAPPDGTLFLTDTVWDDPAPSTDLDTLVFGPSANEYQVSGSASPVYAPYILDTVGASARTYLGSGAWAFNTATGGPEELVTAPAQEGLHAVVQHQVGFDGDKFYVPFETNVGAASVSPTAVDQATPADSGSFDVTFEATLDLPGLTAGAYGLSQPSVTIETAQQDDPDDPSSASVKKTVEIAHASRAVFETALPGNDVDLFVVKDGQIVGSSTTATGNERVELVLPPDGTYEVWVQGWSVVGTPTFPLTIDVIQGTDMTVSGLPAGPLPANTPVTIHVTYSKAMTAGEDYFGELLIGPPAAPAALSVPVTIHRD